MDAAVDDEAFGHRGTRADVVAAAAPVGEIADGILFEIIQPVDEQQMRGHSHVIVNHIKNDRHPPPMEGPHQVLQLPHP